MANTLASGASARKGLEVQLLSWAFPLYIHNRQKTGGTVNVTFPLFLIFVALPL